MEHIAELLDLTPAEVLRHRQLLRHALHPPGRARTWCRCARTSPACSTAATSCSSTPRRRLGVPAGGTTADGEFTLEEVECIALCGDAPCLAVNWRFFGDVTAERLRPAGRRPARRPPGRRGPAPRHAVPGAGDIASGHAPPRDAAPAPPSPRRAARRRPRPAAEGSPSLSRPRAARRGSSSRRRRKASGTRLMAAQPTIVTRRIGIPTRTR